MAETLSHMIIRSFTELMDFPDFESRFEYLKLGGQVGIQTFGFERYLNQKFYHSSEWKSVRDLVIVRDLGCDLGIIGREIYSRPVVHHMNPITVDDLERMRSIVLNPEFLITVSHDTHNAIHYGGEPRQIELVERRPNDTCPWRH